MSKWEWVYKEREVDGVMKSHAKNVKLMCCVLGLGTVPALGQTFVLAPQGADPNGAPFVIDAAVEDVIVFDFYIDHSAGLTVGILQSTMPCSASGGTAGSIDFVGRNLDESRADYIYLGMTTLGPGGTDGSCPSVDLNDFPNLGTLVIGGAPVVTDWVYLGSWTFGVSADAAGTFSLDLFCPLTPPVAPCPAALTFVTGGPFALPVGTAHGVTINVEDPDGDCPDSATVSVNDPPDGVVDARQPHPVGSLTPLQGIDTIEVSAPTDTLGTCWSLCETHDGGGSANGIAGVVDHGDGTHTITLERPITPGAVTRLTYTPDKGPAVTASFIAHPANVNGDSGAFPLDILKEIDCVNGVEPGINCPWGLYSCDANHSAECNSGDILRVIDLLNGADTFVEWNGTSLPAGPCP